MEFECKSGGSPHDSFYYKIESPRYVFKINDFGSGLEDDDDLPEDQEKEYYELKPVEMPIVRRKIGCYDDDFRIEELISEKTILDYDHEIETSSYYDNSMEDNLDFFEYSIQTETIEYSSSNVNISSVSIGEQMTGVGGGGGGANDNGGLDQDEVLNPYQCTKCSEAFKSSLQLISHFEQNHQNEIDYKCVICEELFESAQSMTLHMRMHKDVKRPYACIECGKRFKTLEYLDNHKQHKMCHSEANICTLCGKEFKNQFNLVRHRTVHTNTRRFKCSLCNKMFKNQDNLTVHLRCHRGERPFKCSLCPKAFRDRHHMLRHEKIHTSDYEFQCEKCQKVFRLDIHLEKHMERIHLEFDNKPFECPQCNKKFRREEKFNRHLESHMASGEVLKCRMCTKEFAVIGYLVHHMATVHNRGNSVTVNTTDDEEKSSSSSSQHTKSTDRTASVSPVKKSSQPVIPAKKRSIETPPQPPPLMDANGCVVERVPFIKEYRYNFHCNICDKTFKTPGYLNKHKKTVHKDLFILPQANAKKLNSVGGGGDAPAQMKIKTTTIEDGETTIIMMMEEVEDEHLDEDCYENDTGEIITEG